MIKPDNAVLERTAAILGGRPDELQELQLLKKGMTNRSFTFRFRDRRYILRIPGEGTSLLINRWQEAAAYRAVEGKGICDETLFIDPASGYKLSLFIENARVCDPLDENDLVACMKKLRDFHESALTVDHFFDIFATIDYYESLWGGSPSVYGDYRQTKEQIFSLRPYIERHAGTPVLTHIDAVPDNFLFEPRPDGSEHLQLIDWEYAGMQDPHVDIAMFCIYALYDRAQSDHLIDLYFPEGCPSAIRTKIYCYIAACGLLWSNWCEYKRSLGVDFGDYALRQYGYARDFYLLVQNELESKETPSHA